MHYVDGVIDNIYIQPASNVNGKSYPEIYLYQMTSKGTKNNQPFLERLDIKAPIEFGEIEGAVGKALLFPVNISHYQGKSTYRVPDGLTQDSVKALVVKDIRPPVSSGAGSSSASLPSSTKKIS